MVDYGLSKTLERSDVYHNTGHPCRLDFERFAAHIGLQDKRASKILDSFMVVSPAVEKLIAQSSLTEKLKRHYRSIVQERTQRFIRTSE